MNKLTLAITGTLFLIFAGCSEAPRKTETKKVEEKPAEPVTGLEGLYKMYMAARSWAPDAEILRLRSMSLPEVKAVPGKAAAWEVMFVSPDKRRARSWTYSVIEGEGNLHKGAFAGQEESWGGPRGQAKPFLIAAVKHDTDKAYQTALKKATDYEKKNPGKPISFMLEKTDKFPDPAWRVIWGESVSTSNFSVYVDASTGEFLEIMR